MLHGRLKFYVAGQPRHQERQGLGMTLLVILVAMAAASRRGEPCGWTPDGGPAVRVTDAERPARPRNPSYDIGVI